jgi:PKD repeat protein
MASKILLWKMSQVFVAVFLLIPIVLLDAGPAYSALTQKAVVATAAADWSSGAHSIISVDPVGGPRSVQNNLVPTISDITVKAYGRNFYRFERFGANNVAKFDVGAPETVIWQFSTEGNDTNSNPYDLVFVSSEKAYLLRYGAQAAWIVDPSATVEAEFKTGELNLSAYDPGDGSPDMAAGVIVDGKLFIILQRFDGWCPSAGVPAYVAVFDTGTDQEIDTGQGAGGLKGIPLPINDPLNIQYLEQNDTIYVQGVGSYPGFCDPQFDYTGGIVSVNPDTYGANLILDDGDAANHPYGAFSGMVIVSETKGYFVGYDGWGDNTLYTFDPSTGTVNGPVAGFEGIGIAGMESGAYVDQNDMLWVCNQTNARVDILDTADDTIDESVGTDLNPQKVVFAEAEVIASFQASPTGGEPPLTVSFDASSSSGTIDSYAWNFGDGTTGSGVTIAHEYASEGTFTVTLTVTNDLGTTDTATATIDVEEDDELFGCFIATSEPTTSGQSLPLMAVLLILGVCLIGSIALLRSKRR